MSARGDCDAHRRPLHRGCGPGSVEIALPAWRPRVAEAEQLVGNRDSGPNCPPIALPRRIGAWPAPYRPAGRRSRPMQWAAVDPPRTFL